MAMRQSDQRRDPSQAEEHTEVDFEKASALLGVDLRAALAGPRYTLDDIRQDRERTRAK